MAESRYVQMRLKPERSNTKDTDKHTPTPIKSPLRCNHESEVCRECLASWELDYDIRHNVVSRRELLGEAIPLGGR